MPVRTVLVSLLCVPLALAGCDDDVELVPDGGTDADGDGDSDGDGDGDGDADGDADGDIEPRCTDVAPAAISVTADAVVTLRGFGFVDGGQVTLSPVDGGEPVFIDEVTLGDSGRSASFSLSAGSLEAGLYRVIFTADGLELVCAGSLLVSPTVTDVVPPFAWTGAPGDGVLSDQRVEVVGEGFLVTPSIRFVSVEDSRRAYDATTVNSVSDTSVSAICPSDTRSIPAGDYHVFAVNPSGLSGQWIDEGTGEPGIFEVTEVPPPQIDTIDPAWSPAASEVALTA